MIKLKNVQRVVDFRLKFPLVGVVGVIKMKYLNKFVEIRTTKYIDIKKVLQAQFAI